MVSIANFILIFLSLIVMNGLNNNNSGNDSSIDAVASDSTVVSVAEVNKSMFTQVANMVAAGNLGILASRAEKDAEVQKMLSDRVIDIPNTSMMKTVKLNLTSNGALLLSLNDGKQLTNHPLSVMERQNLDQIVNNKDMTDDQKMQKISNWVTGVALATTMRMDFDNALAQNQSSGLHR